MKNTANRESVPTGTVLTLYPYQMQKGDREAVAFKDGKAIRFASEGFKNEPEANPQGCAGKTHVDSKCYDNVATVTVLRS